MTPDSDLSRLARVEQRVEDLSRQVTDYQPLSVSIASQQAHMEHFQESLGVLRNDVKALADNLEARDAATSKERRDTRVALYSMMAVLGAAIIGAVAAVIAAGIAG